MNKIRLAVMMKRLSKYTEGRKNIAYILARNIAELPSKKRKLIAITILVSFLLRLEPVELKLLINASKNINRHDERRDRVINLIR